VGRLAHPAIKGKVWNEVNTQIPWQCATEAGKSRVLKDSGEASIRTSAFPDVCLGCLSTRHRDGNGPPGMRVLLDSKGPWAYMNGDQPIQCVDAPVVRWFSGLCAGTATERDAFTRTAVMIEASLV